MADAKLQQNNIDNHADKDGQCRRKESQFLVWISAVPNARFPAEADRCVLYIAYTCPCAHRANIVRTLKGVEDIVQLVVMDCRRSPAGIEFYDSSTDEVAKEPLYGLTTLR